MDVLSILSAASSLAPALVAAIPTIEAAFKGSPVSATQGNDAFAALGTAATQLPLLAPVIPIIQKQFDGTPLTTDDIAVLEEVSASLDQAIEASMAKAESTAAPTAS